MAQISSDFDPERSLNPIVNGTKKWTYVVSGLLCFRCGQEGHLSKICDNVPLSLDEHRFLRNMVLGLSNQPLLPIGLRHPKIPRQWHESRPLQELCDSIANSAYDVMFVAIDFEGFQNVQSDLSKNLNCSVGLAVLDTKDFDFVPSTNLISTYYFISGSVGYQQRCQKRSIFGKPTVIIRKDLLKSIKSLIPDDRHVVLVGHDMQHDLQALNALGFDISAYDLSIFDTQKIFTEMALGKQRSLKYVLTALKCPFKRLHCSGNDANFALKALLLLGLKTLIPQSEPHRRLATIMAEVALAPLAPLWQPSPELAMERVKKLKGHSRRFRGRRNDYRKGRNGITSSEDQTNWLIVDPSDIGLCAMFNDESSTTAETIGWSDEDSDSSGRV